MSDDSNILYLKANKNFKNEIINVISEMKGLTKASYQIMFLEPPKLMKNKKLLYNISSKIRVAKDKLEWKIVENKLIFNGSVIKIDNIELIDDCKIKIY